MKPEVKWIKVDLSLPKDKLPYPLRSQAGGDFWIVKKVKGHPKWMDLSWWTGEKFLKAPSDNVTHFAEMEFPDLPQTDTRET